MDNKENKHEIKYNKNSVNVDGVDIDRELLQIMGISNLDDVSIEIHQTTTEELNIFN